MIDESDNFKDMLNGGRDNFSTKDILVEFMKEQKKVNEFIMKAIMCDKVKTSINKNHIDYMKISICSLFGLVVYLFVYVFKLPKP